MAIHDFAAGVLVRHRDGRRSRVAWQPATSDSDVGRVAFDFCSGKPRFEHLCGPISFEEAHARLGDPLIDWRAPDSGRAGAPRVFDADVIRRLLGVDSVGTAPKPWRRGFRWWLRRLRR